MDVVERLLNSLKDDITKAEKRVADESSSSALPSRIADLQRQSANCRLKYDNERRKAITKGYTPDNMTDNETMISMLSHIIRNTAGK